MRIIFVHYTSMGTPLSLDYAVTSFLGIYNPTVFLITPARTLHDTILT